MGNISRNGKYGFKIITLLFLDVMSVIMSYLLGLLIRFDFKFSAIGNGFLESGARFVTAMMFITTIAYLYFRLYHSVWRYASLPELQRIVFAYIFIGVMAGLLMLNPYFRIPRGALLIGYILNFLMCVGLRFGVRLLRYLVNSHSARVSKGKKLLIIGAGQAAQEIIKDIRVGHANEYKIVGLVDDNRFKQNRDLEGISVLGNRYDIPEIVEKYGVEEIFFAITNIDAENRKEILNICKDTGCELQMVPGLYQVYSGELTISRLKHVEIDDLLGRGEVKINLDQILSSLCNKTIMVTGGGGSIGSELCRQIAKANLKLLIIFDIYENSVYEIQQELKREQPDVNVLALIGDMTDRNRVKWILNKYRPDYIYHAAAHKHVPLMEESPNEAIKNNVIGTQILCEEAVSAGVKRFLLISTDKAVNPTNIMGASKRLCEMIIQMMSRKKTDCVFMAVRFGNVLGSNGSVIPLFKKQIAAGGPVTITDKNIIRYFMTIPEAVSLVLQAGYYAKGGEIFVLDMGEPVKIDDMARSLITLSGYKPDVDIKVVYTGLRPGEKMYEELLIDKEKMTKTANNLIYVEQPIEMNDSLFESQLKQLSEVCSNESDEIKALVERIIPAYKRYEKISIS